MEDGSGLLQIKATDLGSVGRYSLVAGLEMTYFVNLQLDVS